MATTGGSIGTPPQFHGRPAVALILMTFVSGLVDAVSYLGLGHVFTANMTGNVVLLGFATAGAPGFSVAASLTSLGAFLVGALGAGRMELAMRRFPRLFWLRAALFVEAAMLAVAAVVAFNVDPADSGGTYALIAILAVAMGLRNATVRKLAVPDMTTTVLTLTITGLAADSTPAGGSNPRAGRRVASVAAMLAGAMLGAALVLHHGRGWPLLVCAVLIAAAGAVLWRETDATPQQP